MSITRQMGKEDVVYVYIHLLLILITEVFTFKYTIMGFPGGAVVESLPANAGDTGSSPGLGGSHTPRSN